MPDYSAVRRGDMPFEELCRGLTTADLHTFTDQLLDTIDEIIADATDADVVFMPEDPEANDPGAAPEDVHAAWTLGHVIVHTTAGAEESAALASTMARGVVYEGRSRYETPWQTVKTIAQVRARLAESRRMRHAFIDTWPDEPHLDITYTPIPRFGPMNAFGRFMLGLLHEDWHLDQLREIVRQAKAARGA